MWPHVFNKIFCQVYMHIEKKKKNDKMWLGKTMGSFDVFSDCKANEDILIYISDCKTL